MIEIGRLPTHSTLHLSDPTYHDAELDGVNTVEGPVIDGGTQVECINATELVALCRQLMSGRSCRNRIFDNSMNSGKNFDLLAMLGCIATIMALGLSGCATGTAGRGVKEEDPNKNQGGFGSDLSHIERAAQFVTESISKVPEFADPTLQPWMVVELDKVDVSNRRLATEAGTFVRRFTTFAMKAQARRANLISVEDYKKAEAWRKKIQDGTVTGGEDDPKIVNYRSPDFLLEITISDATQTNPNGKRLIYMLYSFRLTDRRTLRLVWQEDFRVVTSASVDAAHR